MDWVSIVAEIDRTKQSLIARSCVWEILLFLSNKSNSIFAEVVQVTSL